MQNQADRTDQVQHQNTNPPAPDRDKAALKAALTANALARAIFGGRN